MELSTTRLIVRPQNQEMLDELVAYLARNREFHRPWAPLHPEAWYARAEQARRLLKSQVDAREGRGYRFWYATQAKPNRMIGHASLSSVVRGAFQSCHLGYSQDQTACGQGYMTEALKAILHFAFEEVGLHRVEANVVPQNQASRGVLERLSFVQEGAARRFLKINGGWEDHLRFAILREEFLAR
ncbi:MAG: GNAT family N-acetyltransferase [Bacteroidota bacterium]